MRALAVPVLVATLLAGCATERPTGPVTAPSVTSSSTETDVADVTCTDSGAQIDHARVAAQPDGVHFSFQNTTARSVHIAYWRGGTALGAGESVDVVRPVPPGTVTTVACAVDLADLSRHGAPVTVTDPSAVYVAVPQCSGGSAVRDFVAGAARAGDPLDLTRRDHPHARVVGYPEADPRQVYTGSQLYGWESVNGGWVPTYVTRCP